MHEIWSCEDDYHDHDYRGRWRNHYDEEDDDDDGEAGDYELIELIDSDIELRHWIAPDSQKKEAISIAIDDSELCYTKPSIDCEPFETEHEGYTGNAGNTVDHWYHRAAIVMWPRERTFVIRAKASPRWAVDEVTRTLGSSGREQALEQVDRMLSFWLHGVDRCERQDRPALLDATLRLGIGLDDARRAATLLAPFRLVDVAPDAAPHVAGLLERYGIDGCRAVLQPWMTDTRFNESTDDMLGWLTTTLRILCRALCRGEAQGEAQREARGVARREPATEGEVLAGELLENRWTWLYRHIAVLCRQTNPEHTATALSGLGEPLLAILESCDIARQSALRDKLLALLTDRADTIPLQLPLAVLKAAGPHAAWRDQGLEPVRQHLVRKLTALLARPARADDDWSIRTPLRGSIPDSGMLSETLLRFLRAPDQVRLDWPLNEQRRRQIHDVIDSHGLPVRHTTRRAGSPYTLMLEKTRALFERDAAERRFWADELAWLEGGPAHRRSSIRNRPPSGGARQGS